VIRVFDCTKTEIRCSLRAHLQAINDLKFHPSKPYLLLSASSDESLRLWDIRTGRCTAIFHSDSYSSPVYSCDFHPNGEQFVSAGGKNAVLVWSAEDRDINKTSNPVVRSSRKPEIRKFAEYVVMHAKTKCQDKWVVDGVAWYGDMLFMKTIAPKCISLVYGTLVDVADKRKKLLGLPLEEQYDKEDAGLDFRVLESLSFSDAEYSPKKVDSSPHQRFHVQDCAVYTGVLPDKIVEWSTRTSVWSEINTKGLVLDTALSSDNRIMLVATMNGVIQGFQKYCPNSMS